MNPRQSEFEVRAAPPTSVTRQTRETAQTPVRAPADANREDESADQPIEEPGYGHGV
jgi:hypothetical protein